MSKREQSKQGGHGGKRTGAGRKPKKKTEEKIVSLHARVPQYLKKILDDLDGTQSELIVNALIKTYNIKRGGVSPPLNLTRLKE